jgi:RNA 3'-terminal phosphate cyclase (ATP)
MIDIDGAIGEGGGQILRSSLALSLLTGKPFRLRNIRAGRSKPGLQPQHLMSVRAAAAVGSATIRGDSLGSRELEFAPGEVRSGDYHFRIGTAGATGLVLHTVYLPLALRGTGVSRVNLEGGTHVTTSPCFHFLEQTWRGYLALMGIRLKLKMARPGFYPRGGGFVEATIQPCQAVQPVSLVKSTPPGTVTGISAAAGLPDHVSKRQARRARFLLEKAGLASEISEEAWEGGPGSVLVLSVGDEIPSVFVGLGARGKPAESVADDAAKELCDYVRSGEPVDSHSADQIILPLVFADGPSEYRTAPLTRHLTTNIDTIGKFIDRPITCEGAEGKPATIRIGHRV